MVVQDESAKILLALQFLTRIPIPRGVLYTEQRFADTPRYYPLIGAFVGLLCAALLLAAVQVFPQTLAVSLMVAGGILLTGAFHEDGLADTFDGVGGGQDRDKALNIGRYTGYWINRRSCAVSTVQYCCDGNKRLCTRSWNRKASINRHQSKQLIHCVRNRFDLFAHGLCFRIGDSARVWFTWSCSGAWIHALHL